MAKAGKKEANYPPKTSKTLSPKCEARLVEELDVARKYGTDHSNYSLLLRKRRRQKPRNTPITKEG